MTTEEPHFITYSIYKISCKDTNIKDIYVGSTMNVAKRTTQHKHKCLVDNQRQVYKCIRNNGGWDNWQLTVLDVLKCPNKRTAEIVERYYIEQLKATLNSVIPIISENELKEIITHHNKKSGQIFHECQCGKRYSLKNRARHFRSMFHQNFLSNPNIQEEDAALCS